MQQSRSILVELTRMIGQPQNEYVIIGEGNTSCRIDDETFWVKASGQGMETIGDEGFVAVKFAPILDMLDNPPATVSEQKAIQEAAKVDPNTPQRPSVEVGFHAALLHDCGVQYIGHTHPIAINQIMASSRAQQFAKRRMCPDEIVLCGPESVFVPYIDPGLPLAIEMRKLVQEYMRRYDEAPKAIVMANHGFIALGDSPTEIRNITAMAVKAARIFAGACALGEPVFLPHDEVMHIYRRPDEIYRRKAFV